MGDNFLAYIKAKTKILSGDLFLDNIGLSKEDEDLIINTVDIIINVAASVDFNAPLLDNININIFGC